MLVPFLGGSCPQLDLSQPARAEPAPPVDPALSWASEEATGKMQDLPGARHQGAEIKLGRDYRARRGLLGGAVSSPLKQEQG